MDVLGTGYYMRGRVWGAQRGISGGIGVRRVGVPTYEGVVSNVIGEVSNLLLLEKVHELVRKS